MTERLDGTVALVTGASSGIGEATARELARNGAAVALVARRKDRLDALAEEIGAGGGTAVPIEADITDQQQSVGAVERTVRELGRLDILVNNAGVMLLGPIEDAPVEEWERMIAINVRGLLYCAHATIPHLLKAADSEPRHVASLLVPSTWLGTVRIQVVSADQGVPVFVGIARDVAVRRYLHGAAFSQISDFGREAVPVTAGGGAPRTAPIHARIWAASASGTGPQTVRWKAQTGTWSVVVMNADGSKGVDVAATAGATVPALIWIASGLLIAGGVFLAIAVLLIVLGVRRPRRREATAG